MTMQNFVPHGSEKHALMLGLVKATEKDEKEGDVVVDGYKLSDPTPLITLDPTGRLERITLRQKVSELTSPLPKVQSVNPQAPGYAPPLWVPPDDKELRTLVEAANQ